MLPSTVDFGQMPWCVSFHIYGEAFRPSRVPFQFTKQHDPGIIGIIGRYRGQPVPYGCASYEVPSSVPNIDRIKHVVETFEPLLGEIRAAGATDWHIDICRYYNAQCNEGYTLEEMQLISRLQCGFTYSAYSVSKREERKLERKLETFEKVETIEYID